MKQYIVKGFLLISALTLLVSGCNKWLDNEFVPLTSNMYPSYAEGDTFVYKSIVTGDLDTFVISDFILDTVFNGTILYERTSAIFGKIVSDTFGEDFFYISNDPNGAAFGWDSSYAYFTNPIITLDTTIQGFDYSSVLVASAPRQDTVSEKLYKLYFEYKFGLLKYNLNNLDSFELFSRPE